MPEWQPTPLTLLTPGARLPSVSHLSFSKHSTRPEVAKGDYVHIDNGILPFGFLGVCLDNYRNRAIRFCDVYGLFHEAGSVYALDLSKLNVTRHEFKQYLGALHDRITELTERPPDSTTEDFDRDTLLKNLR